MQFVSHSWECGSQLNVVHCLAFCLFSVQTYSEAKTADISFSLHLRPTKRTILCYNIYRTAAVQQNHHDTISTLHVTRCYSLPLSSSSLPVPSKNILWELKCYRPEISITFVDNGNDISMAIFYYTERERETETNSSLNASCKTGPFTQQWRTVLMMTNKMCNSFTGGCRVL
jgi:hypothetical protein